MAVVVRAARSAVSSAAMLAVARVAIWVEVRTAACAVVSAAASALSSPTRLAVVRAAICVVVRLGI